MTPEVTRSLGTQEVKMSRRIRNLAVGFTAYGLLGFVLTGLTSLGLVIASAFSSEPIWVWFGLAALVQVIGGVVYVPSIVAAYGLRSRTRWSRAAAIIAGIIVLSDLPLGFILGCFSLVTMYDPEASQLLSN